MRVLGLVHRYVPAHNAGAETMLHSMLRALALRGHDVDVVLSAQPGEPYELDGVRVHPFQNKGDVFRFLGDADVIISHLMNTPRATFIGNWNHVPVVLINHNTFGPTKNAALTPQARVDLAVVNSQWMADDLAAHYAELGVPQRQPRTIVVRPLVDAADYAALDGPHDRVTLVNMKMLAEDSGLAGPLSKGSETFWAVAARMPKTKFLGVTGAYGNQMAGDLPNVEVIGHVPATEMAARVFARTRVLLVPSNYESWGRVASEAICSGIPVIASPTAGLIENLGDAGTYIEPADIDGWVRALRTLALPGPYAAAHRRALARAAEHQALRTHDEEVWVSSVESVGSRHRSLASLAR